MIEPLDSTMIYPISFKICNDLPNAIIDLIILRGHWIDPNNKDIEFIKHANDTRILSLDYDDTITRDPIFFKFLSECLLSEGWSVIVTSYREELGYNRTLIRKILQLDVPVYLTGWTSKIQYLSTLGIHPEIFVDDTPRSLYHNL